MKCQPRDPAGRWIAVEPDAPGGIEQLAACLLIIATIAAGLIL